MHSITADFSDFIKKIELLKEIITSIHSMKKYMDIPLGKKLASKIETNDQLTLDLIKENSSIINLMAGVEIKQEIGLHTIPVVVGNAILHMEFDGGIDVKAELARLYKEISKLEKVKKDALTRLDNKEFLEKASEDIVQEHKARIANVDLKVSGIKYVIKSLESM